jgi:hypothetical protein
MIEIIDGYMTAVVDGKIVATDRAAMAPIAESSLGIPFAVEGGQRAAVAVS